MRGLDGKGVCLAEKEGGLVAYRHDLVVLGFCLGGFGEAACGGAVALRGWFGFSGHVFFLSFFFLLLFFVRGYWIGIVS